MRPDGLRRTACDALLVKISKIWNVNLMSVWCVTQSNIFTSGSFQSHQQRKAGKFQTIIATPYSEARVSFWKRRTSQPFEYSIDGVDAINTKYVKCHYCSSIIDGGKPIHHLLSGIQY
jgi:hypothetical protein